MRLARARGRRGPGVGVGGEAWLGCRWMWWFGHGLLLGRLSLGSHGCHAGPSPGMATHGVGLDQRFLSWEAGCCGPSWSQVRHRQAQLSQDAASAAAGKAVHAHLSVGMVPNAQARVSVVVSRTAGHPAAWHRSQPMPRDALQGVKNFFQACHRKTSRYDSGVDSGTLVSTCRSRLVSFSTTRSARRKTPHGVISPSQ